MSSNRFDVIVVGARCAGAALAQRLAQAGMSVALLDAAQLPSGQRTSTHLIQPPGMDELDELGAGGAVRARAPALEAMRLAFDGHETRLRYGLGREAYCLRRELLDPLLQDAAACAGAQVRPRSGVVGLLWGPHELVAGVEVRREGRRHEQLRADLVVGADGRNSTVAKCVGASEYFAYPGPRACYWAYWRRPAGWNAHELCNFYRGDDAYVVFPTDGDELLIASAPPVARARAWRGDHRDAYLASLASHEPIGSQLGDEEPLGEVRGVIKTRYFFRASAGPGWALIGDAGHHKEFVLGLGISDALRDAHALSRAILDGGPAAIETWWRTRDAARIELFHWGRDVGRAEPVDALRRLTARGMAHASHLEGRLGEVIDGRLSPFDLIPPRYAIKWVAASLLRGDPSPLPPLGSSIRRRLAARRELRRRLRVVSAR